MTDELPRTVVPGSPPSLIPEALVSAVLSGDCVAFVGAGFSAAAGLPSWTQLLNDVASAAALSSDEMCRFDSLLRRGGGHALDQAAQLLEDRLNRRELVRILSERFAVPTPPAVMQRRLWLLKRVPFRAILTTNFDGILPGEPAGPSAYAAVLRPEPHRVWEETVWHEEAWRPVVKLHGNLDAKAEHDSVVLTRRDYRRRLYQDAAYITFLRSVLATTTVLYLGFSFDDAYLNELRSEVLAMLGQDREGAPLAYAVANDIPNATSDLFLRHEGIQFLSFSSSNCTDYSGFDRYLEALYEATNPVPRLARFLESRRILWLDSHPDNNEVGRDFLERAAARVRKVALHPVKSVDHALDALAQASREDSYDLIITHWGEAQAGTEAEPTAVALLKAMRRRDLRAPVMVFSRAHDVERRRRTVMALGAYGYFFRFETLFEEMKRLFEGPEPS